MSILADIAHGNTGFADIMFLVGFILFLIAAFFGYRPLGDGRPVLWSPIVCLGLAAVSLGWLVL